MNSVAKLICLWHLVNSISIIKSLFKSTHMNTHIQKKPEKCYAFAFIYIFCSTVFVHFLYTSTSNIYYFSNKKKTVYVIFKTQKLKGNLVWNPRREHRKGLGAHLASITHSWVQAEHWTSLDLCSCLWKVKMVESVWWNLRQQNKGQIAQRYFLKGPFSRG